VLPPLTIRARLTVSYAVAMVLVLLVVAVAVSIVHERIGMGRIDATLAGQMQSVAGVVTSEIAERLTLEAGAQEAMAELELPGLGVAVLDRAGRPLATRNSDAPNIPLDAVRSAAGRGPRTLEPQRARIAASAWRHGAEPYSIVVWTSLLPFDREHATVQNTIRASIPFAALAALAAGWLIVWRALQPLSRMAACADGIDTHRLDARLPVPAATDEIQRLAIAFNGLMSRLSDAVHAQRRFMADASHELRTPVTVARTAAQVTLDSPHRTDAEYREALDIITLQTDRLTHVVDDMFLLARADVDARPLDLRYLYLDEMVTECVRAAAVLADRRQVGVTVQAPEGVQIRGDEELLRRMIMNLLDNAIRHTPDRGHVRASVAQAEGSVTVTVEDSGPGIPAAERERVFERFVRLATANSQAGGGLGLPIARWIAEQHHGTLRLDGSHSGGCFVATLPLQVAAGASGV